LSAPVSAPKEYNRRNEIASRNYYDGELADTYRKSSNLIVPSSFYLGFQGATGKQVVLGLNGSDEFTISIDGATAFALASSSSVTAVQSEVTAARSGEASLLARVTTVNTTATNAGTAAATAQSEVTAARQGEASLTAKVTALSTATSTVDGKLSASYALTVDGGGRIASMKLLSDGTTSSVKFTASTFQVYNGTTDEAPFEVSGGAVKIKTANVGVLSAANISVSSLDAISATIGLLRTASTGARMELESNQGRVYDSSNVLRVRWGIWT